jgi:hypothetical protein
MMKRSTVKLLLLILLAAAWSGVSGCASDEPGNASVRPWNSPQGWENGLPVDLNQQHE